MRKFINFMLFSLLAVGWTVGAQAQALAKPTVPENLRHTVQKKTFNGSIPFDSGTNGFMRAPQRSPYTITADEVRTGDWWSTKTYTWYNTYPASGTPQTANFTDPATDPYQMMYMVKEIYINPLYPGIQYNEVEQAITEYPGIGYGWNIEEVYKDFVITFNNSYAYFTAVTILDYSTEQTIESWSSSTTSNTVGTLPSWLTANKTIQKTNLGSNYNPNYVCYMNNGGTLTIKGSSLAGHQAVTIIITARTSNNGGGTINIDGASASLTTTMSDWSLPRLVEHGISTPPDYNGYTVMLVKVKNDATDFPTTTSTAQELIDGCFTKYESIELLTDGLRVGEGTSNAGTVFAYTGTLNRFFFISKGKTAQWTAIAPFYQMYEEFSPTTVEQGAETTDFYEKMKQGTTYDIEHDCQSVSQMEHYFSMSGKEGTTSNLVNSLVFYIPDDRSTSLEQTAEGWVTSREYDHKPTVGIYMIDLYADVEPSSTPDYYTVTVNWYDNLDEITHSENIPQTYKLYEIRYNEETGQNDTTLVYEGPDTSWNFDYPVGDPTYYDLHYYVIGTPRDATNQDTFFAKSNTDDVTIPGKEDFLGLQWWRYESDYVTDDGINQEVNYYRNWLAPHALAVQGETGITAGNVGTEGRTLTLYRDDNNGNVIPVIDLELVMDGNKAYYRIKYRPNTQKIEPGYNEDGERISTNN